MGKLRIVGGKLRGRRLDVPDSVHVRPTSDRVRESLFNILGSEVMGARVLDLFAGSGALGFEALSRGAAGATFLELDGRVARHLGKSARHLGLEAMVSVVPGDFASQAVRRRLKGPFGLVLADPPYGWATPGEILEGLRGLLVPGGLLVLEVERGTSPPVSAGWRPVKTATYGRACLLFYRLDELSVDHG